jgi:hypothetical protein
MMAGMTELPHRLVVAVALLLVAVASPAALAGVGDPQVKTDDPWYPGELSCSTFPRLFATQAELYRRVTGRGVESDEDKALASWYWRNLHYAHGEEGKGNCLDNPAGFTKSEWNREYWQGLFAHGFGLCGTTHSQYTVEMEALLGHCRGRCVGVTGHNSFEAFLTGGEYGAAGKWTLLDHDLSTVIFDPDGQRLLGIKEIIPNLARLKDPTFKPQRQRGWRVAGEHDADAAVYDSFQSVEYLSGYAGPPPMVHLRAGETLRRYLRPGLEDGKTFVFWGMNYRQDGIPGPARDRTWVNQPQNMYMSRDGAGYHPGQARYANAVYTYAPDLKNGSYKEGVIADGPEGVTFEFTTPYVIAATPPNDKPWGIYEAGGSNGLVIHGKTGSCRVSVSVDHGRNWRDATGAAVAPETLDLTDLVKGRQQYWLRFGAAADALAGMNLSWRTVCQCNAAIIPRLHDGTNKITLETSGRALFSAGPQRDIAAAHLVEGEGKLDSGSNLTLELAPPRGQKAVHLYASSWQSSGNPPSPDVAYRIDYSLDGGKSWQPVVRDWHIVRRPPEPADLWSQSFCWGDVELPAAPAGAVRVRFSNNGGKTYRNVEAHLAYDVVDRRRALAEQPPMTVTFAWREGKGGGGGGGDLQTASKTYRTAPATRFENWSIDAGQNVQTEWVQYAAPAAAAAGPAAQ